VGCGYKTVAEPSDPAICEKFIDVMRNGPSEMIDFANNMRQRPNNLLSSLQNEESKSEPEDKEKSVFNDEL
jgi:hypothetical protein